MMLPISVQALRSRDRCQRLFALQYRAGCYWPGVQREPSEDMRLGEAFHKLVVRHRLGVPVSPSPAIGGAWAAFLASPYAAPHGPGGPNRQSGPSEQYSAGGQSEQYGAGGQSEPRRPGESPDVADVADTQIFSEQTLQLSLEGVPFLVRCDEIRRQGDQWTILDWKTGRVRESDLACHWQTRLYRFALALAGSAIGAGGAIPPGNIKMVYLLVRLEKALEFPYDPASFVADRALFTEIAGQADAPLDSLARPEDPQTCQTCRFDSLCNARSAPPASSAARSLPRFV